jgi:hypothetical protein
MNRQQPPPPPPNPPQQRRRPGNANPGARHHRQQANAQRNQQQQINAAVPNYRATQQYLALDARQYTSAAQIARANRWILANQAHIDPNEVQICTECDFGADFTICACKITPVQQQHQQAVPNIHAGLPDTLRVGQTWRDWFWGKEQSTFSFHQQNNSNLDEFTNSTIDDAYIVPELYNFITGNMYVSYVNSAGVEDRRLRIEHCKRLSARYLETNKMDCSADTMLNNRVKFTVQRSCDQIENEMLYREHRPMHESNFWKAWWPRFGMVFLMVLSIYSMYVVGQAFSSQPATTVRKSRATAVPRESTTSASSAVISRLGNGPELSSPLDQVMELCVASVAMVANTSLIWMLDYACSNLHS